MTGWVDDKRIVRTYCLGNGKKSIEKHKGIESVRTYDDVTNSGIDYGFIPARDIVDISFDDPEMFKTALNMAKVLKWNCRAIINPLNNHGHMFFRKPRNFGKDGKDKTLACGLIADIHSCGIQKTVTDVIIISIVTSWYFNHNFSYQMNGLKSCTVK